MDDYISRQDAIDALKICDNNEDGINCHKCPLRDKRWDGAWQDDETNCYTKLMRDSAKLLELQSVQPRKGKWLRSGSGIFPYECDQCGDTNERSTSWCPHCGCRMEEGE